MAIYNFRVRALDDTGAFADRDFAMDVRNSSMERLVAVTANHAFTSADGVTWTKREYAGGRSVEHGGGRWVISGQFAASTANRPGGTIMVSKDGINWVAVRLPMSSAGSGGGVLVSYCGGYWVACYASTRAGVGLSVARTTTPEDAASWVETVTLMSESFHPTRILHDGMRFIVVVQGRTNAVSNPKFYASTDFATWTPYTVNSLTGVVTTSYNRNDMAFVGGSYILAFQHTSGTVFYTSRDLNVWVPYDTVSLIPASTRVGRLCYGNGILYASLARYSGSNTITQCIYSTDAGRTWAVSAFDAFDGTNTGSFLTSMCFANGQFLMVPASLTANGVNSATIKVGTNPTNWSTRSIPTIPVDEASTLWDIAGLSTI